MLNFIFIEIVYSHMSVSTAIFSLWCSFRELGIHMILYVHKYRISYLVRDLGCCDRFLTRTCPVWWHLFGAFGGMNWITGALKVSEMAGDVSVMHNLGARRYLFLHMSFRRDWSSHQDWPMYTFVLKCEVINRPFLGHHTAFYRCYLQHFLNISW